MNTFPFDHADTLTATEFTGVVPEIPAQRIHCATEEQWLDARRKCVGASEIAIIMGASTFTSPYALWWRKKLDWRLPSTESMRWGHLVEDPIATLFVETRTTSKVFKPVGAPWSLWADANLPWMICTPDRLVVEQDGTIVPLEIKSDEGGKGWGETGTDEVPQSHRLQLMWQAHIFGAPGGYIARKKGSGKGSLHWYWVPYNGVLVGEMISAGAEFLFDIDHDREPAPDGSKATTETLKDLNPAIDAGTEAEVNLFLYYEWVVAREDKRAATAKEALASNRLRAQMGRAEFASIKTRDGFLVPFAKRSMGKRAGYSVAPGTTDRLDQIGEQPGPGAGVLAGQPPQGDDPSAEAEVREEGRLSGSGEGVEMGNGQGGGAGGEGAASPSYTCPTCELTSYHSGDIENRYCVHCKVFEADQSEFLAVDRLGREFSEALEALKAKDLPPELDALVRRAIMAETRRRRLYRPVEVAAILDQMHATDDAHRLRKELDDATVDPEGK